MTRLALLLLPPLAALAVLAVLVRVDAVLHARRATPEMLIDDAASALLGDTFAFGVAVAFLLMHGLIVLPLMRRTALRVHGRRAPLLATAGLVAAASAAVAAILLHESSVDHWAQTLGVTSLFVGLPVLVLGVTATLLQQSPVSRATNS